jgi:NAD(P)-dependent dehydrogenase (short-subunit alcohol dehydrogenase family)
MGANLILLGRDQKRLNVTKSQLVSTCSVKIYSLDITDFKLLEATIKEAVDNFGKLNGFINSAGISTTLPLRAIKPHITEHYLNTNVTSAVELARICTKKSYFAIEGGSLVFLSSVMGVVGEVGKTTYSMTKGALLAGTKSMALELGKRKIRVNCISPGVVESPMSQQAVYSQDETSRKRIEAMHPLGLGKPDDIANACIYLLSDASRWVTGTNLIIDGGYTAH